MSSSSLLQWMPCPRPINHQLLRSAAVAWTSLGNQASGTDRLRPSLSFTVSVSSVTATVSAAGTAISIAGVLIPRLPQTVLIPNPKSRSSAHQGLFCKRPWRLEDDCLQYYCTSTVMVWVAATRPWSFVAPVTVIWCVPLLRPLKVP